MDKWQAMNRLHRNYMVLANEATDQEGDQLSQSLRVAFLSIIDECTEALHEVHWKPWKEPTGIKNRDALVEELSDVLHFFHKIMLIAGISEEEMFQAYATKASKNIDRLTDKDYLND